jgi:hypothetical protein
MKIILLGMVWKEHNSRIIGYRWPRMASRSTAISSFSLTDEWHVFSRVLVKLWGVSILYGAERRLEIRIYSMSRMVDQ